MKKTKSWTPYKPKISAKRTKRLKDIRNKLAKFDEELRDVSGRRSERLQAEKVKHQREQESNKKKHERARTALDNTRYSTSKSKARFIKHNQ